MCTKDIMTFFIVSISISFSFSSSLRRRLIILSILSSNNSGLFFRTLFKGSNTKPFECLRIIEKENHHLCVFLILHDNEEELKDLGKFLLIDSEIHALDHLEDNDGVKKGILVV